ncbi:glycosyltransferase family 2 protein [Phormidium yuhuli AB48]|uniref:Glycosyltransferase family 2 protein n=1 Tax=Phormidium yuhuli AB48 TaxID=2940671 RepID=A0ABY5APD9_9CYAN|nr:glycosyltransferase family 2 protein [Phormidium yuhuli]USR90875.1 glycosyltransferase family 2 protein [Phormidium yuhuli AB48]
MSVSKPSLPGLISEIPQRRGHLEGGRSSSSPAPLQFSLVIPTYNERHNLRSLIERLSQLLDRLLGHDYELIIVDDDSPDRTWELAQDLADSYPQVRALRRQGERGLSTAVICGWQRARGQILGVIDADLQHPPEVLEQLWQQIERGADLALASRHVDGGGVSDWSLRRRLLSRGAQLLGLVLLPGVVGRVSDPMSGFFLVRRAAISERFLDPVGYKILIEVLGRGDISWIGEVGYVFQEREQGESKVTWKQYWEYLQHLWKLRLDLLPVQRFLRFGVVGLSGVFIDLAVFYVLREQWQLGLTRSAILSAEVAILNNFYWNDIWTFSDLSRQQQGWRKRVKRLLKFNMVCLAGLILNVLIVNLLFNLLGVNEYLAKLLAIALVTLWNFSINLKLSWRVTDVSDP